MASFRLSPNAEADLYRIWLHGVERWGVEAADAWHASLFERFRQIADRPFMYPAVSDIREGYRRSVLDGNSICYRLDGETAEIMAIIGRQDLDKWL